MRSVRGWVFVLLAMAVAVVGCHQPTAEEAASEAAKAYYERLMAGDYDGFLAGKADVEALPDSYREQLLAAVKQYAFKQREEHAGMLDVRISNARQDTALQVMQVFLVLCFGDSTSEEIVLPMVERQGAWKMK